MINPRSLCVLLLLILCACNNSDSEIKSEAAADKQVKGTSKPMTDPALQAKIEEALDWLEGRGPYLASAIASGFNVVRSVLLDHPKLKVLYDNPKPAVTGILMRRAKLGEKAGPFTRISWYLVLEKSKDPRGVSPILDDLAALKDEDASHVNALGYPFRYGIDALKAIRPDVKLDGSWEILFRERKLLADRY